MNSRSRDLLDQVGLGSVLDRESALTLGTSVQLEGLMAVAGALRDESHGGIVSYSRKVFIPLTHLCRDVCHYCTFAKPPRKGADVYMSRDEVLAVAKAGADAGCREALFTLGDKPELRYSAARQALDDLGHPSTLSYLAEVAQLVFEETGLLAHVNPGVMTRADILALRDVSVSQGLMLESASERLCERGGPHFGSPDKKPAARLETLRLAGEASVPMTTGILIGIGETREERVDTLLAIRDLSEAFGHIQEVIIQNFRAKPDTRMAAAPEPSAEELLWTVAMARLILGSNANIQAPPNLSPDVTSQLVAAGINDWGGVSPVTPDFVNPEAPWPHLDLLAEQSRSCGKELVERLAIYPAYAMDADRWLAPAFWKVVTRAIDSSGLARTDPWSPGTSEPSQSGVRRVGTPSSSIRSGSGVSRILARCGRDSELSEDEIVRLFAARGAEFDEVCKAADALRAETVGDAVTYAVNRNINYTNVCSYRCQFCAFSKGNLSESLRGRPYVVDLDEIARRTAEAWDRGATEVCMQGGIHPSYTGATYLEICRTAKEAAPGIHVHAFTPLEITQGASTLGMPIVEYLGDLIDAGLGTLPGTAAEILDDEVRDIICPDKVNTQQWLDVMRTAHELGLRSTTTIMFGHVETSRHWAHHLIRIRDLQRETGGFTEFVPLPFVHMEAPIYLKGRARRGPTLREAVLMHAVARLALHPHIVNIQTSWVKMGPEGAKACLEAGANDLGGTLMNESISRAAGAAHGQEMPPESMEALIEELRRTAVQRTTLYGAVPQDRTSASFGALPLSEPVFVPAKAFERVRGHRDTEAQRD